MGAEISNQRRVLVADDDHAFVAVVRTILQRAGFHCTCVEDGHSASTCLREGGYDALVADIHMPGNELLQLLHTSRDCGVPTVVVTGDPTLDTAIASLRGGAIDYVVKPFQPSTLLAGLERALTRSKLESEMVQSIAKLNDLAQRVLGSASSTSAANGPDESLSSRLVESGALQSLSNREREVARLFADAKSPAEIAEHLDLSENTVRNHLKAIYRKFGVHSQLELFVKLTETRR